MEGALANADSAATSEVAARCQNLDARPHESSALQRSDGASERKGIMLELSPTGEDSFPLTKTRESPCPRGCRVCFLARKYGLTPREVNLIALISSGRSSRAMSRIMGIGITTIRECCRTIHRKIGTHSRLAIGLWAIRKGMVKSAVQPKSAFSFTEPITRGCPAMKSKLLQKKSYNQTRQSEVLDGKHR
jgi:DNA-binding CsgD family transcriptional regulator